jgi:hypothetical protein
MWIFTQKGFVSVVEYDPKADKHKGNPFAGFAHRRGTHVLVRSRVKDDIEDLRRVVPNMKVLADTSADYKFRAVIKRKDFNKWLLLSADEIDYDSHFKEAAQKNSTGAIGRYAAYMSVWSAMMRLQTAPSYTPGYNPKPLIGKGGRYGSVNEYLADSGYKTPEPSKPWTPSAGSMAYVGKVEAPVIEDDAPQGDVELDDLRDFLRNEPLEALSATTVSAMTDAAWDAWCYLDMKAERGEIDPTKVLSAQELDAFLSQVDAWMQDPADGEGDNVGGGALL